MSWREFKSLSPEGEILGTYHAATPAAAARKAALRTGSPIALIQEHFGNGVRGPQIHAYEAEISEIPDHERSEFQRQHGMNRRASVSKLGVMRGWGGNARNILRGGCYSGDH